MMIHLASRFALQVANALLRVGSPGFSGGSTYQIGWLVQWMCRAVEPSTAAGVDPDTMRKARELVESVGTDNQREIATLCGRLEGYARAAEATTAQASEREYAERMFVQGQALLKALCSSEQTFKAIY